MYRLLYSGRKFTCLYLPLFLGRKSLCAVFLRRFLVIFSTQSDFSKVFIMVDMKYYRKLSPAEPWLS